jgi:hypothetical protein
MVLAHLMIAVPGNRRGADVPKQRDEELHIVKITPSDGRD